MEKTKIVVIDDEKDICFLVQTILGDTGLYDVLTANDGEEGKKLCSQEKPSLILMDYVMPKIKGDQVIAFLKSKPETKRIPIVLMSGLGEMIYLQKKDKWQWAPNTKVVQDRGELLEPIKWKNVSSEFAASLGISAYIQKPFTKDTLLSVIRESLEARVVPGRDDLLTDL